MLDYAANAVVHWPVEAIQARFEEACQQRQVEPESEIAALIAPESDVDAFWQRVKTNLQAGRVRMVFVADMVPPELRRIVEFLNGQMDPAEVLAVEIRQFVGQDLRTLVPRVIGQTIEAERKKTGAKTPEKQWDEVSFFEDLQRRRGDKEATAARSLLAWAKASVPRIWWGKGNVSGSFYPMLDYNGEKHFVTAVWSYGRVEVPFKRMMTREPFNDEAKRTELLGRLNAVPGINTPADGITRLPAFDLAVLTDGAALKAFLTVLEWYIAEVKAAN